MGSLEGVGVAVLYPLFALDAEGRRSARPRVARGSAAARNPASPACAGLVYTRGVKNSEPCPCRSGHPYGACCRPAHSGAVAPATCGALVRARYSAFALGDGEYLYATLAHDHPDRATEPEAVDARIAELSRAGRALKYMGVVVGDETETEALFLAKVFERGQDRSFAELSTFTRALDGEGGVGGALRYAGGTLLPRAALPRGMADGAGLRRDAFLALAATHKDTVRS